MWPCHAPRGDPTTLKKIQKFFIDHKLLDDERIMLKCPTLILPKNECGPATPLRVAKLFLGIFSIFLDNKLHDTKGILISN